LPDSSARGEPAAPLALFAGARTLLADAAQARGGGAAQARIRADAASAESNDDGEARRAFASRWFPCPVTAPATPARAQTARAAPLVPFAGVRNCD
jgi:hypothetical protein